MQGVVISIRGAQFENALERDVISLPDLLAAGAAVVPARLRWAHRPWGGGTSPLLAARPRGDPTTAASPSPKPSTTRGPAAYGQRGCRCAALSPGLQICWSLRPSGLAAPAFCLVRAPTSQAC